MYIDRFYSDTRRGILIVLPILYLSIAEWVSADPEVVEMPELLLGGSIVSATYLMLVVAVVAMLVSEIFEIQRQYSGRRQVLLSRHRNDVAKYAVLSVSCSH